MTTKVSGGSRAGRWLALLGVAAIALVGSGGDCEGFDPLDQHPSVDLRDGPIYMLEGGVLEIEADMDDEPGNAVLLWESSAPGVASVSNAGVVTALEEGTTVITATIQGTEASDQVSVTVVPMDQAAVVLDHNLSGDYQAGDTILLSRITNGRPADPDACHSIHLHTGFDGPGITIDGDDGPFTDPNPTECGFGRIIAVGPGFEGVSLRAAPLQHHHEH